jgi:hypothetical protein
MLTWRHLGLLAIVACGFENQVGDPSDSDLLIGFEFIDSGADELSGTVTIPVVLSRPAEEAVSVSYSLLNSTAMPGSDFTIEAGTLVFAVGEMRKEIQATITNDMDMTETAEDFNIALSNPIGARLDQAKAIHRVTISDHVLPRANLSGVSTMSGENQPSNLMVMLDRPAEEGSFVVIGVAGGGAAPINVSQDVTITDNVMVAIPKGATTALVAIGEKDDTLDEEDAETAVFTLRGASTNIVLGVTRNLNHNILDNDAAPSITWQAASQNVPENIVLGTTAIDIRLQTQSGRTVRVDYMRDANDTADNGDATVIGSGNTVTFSPGETSKRVFITIDNDSIDEDTETVLIDLSNPVNTTISSATHTININDNDTAAVSFSMSSRTVTEGTTTSVNIVMDRESTKTVSVSFSRTGGSATQGEDWDFATSSPVTFNPGETSKTVNFNVPSSSPGNESNETVQVDLGTPSGGAVRVNPTRFTLTIQED